MKPLLLTLILSTASFAQDAFWTIYELETIPEKKAVFRTLDHEERVDVWRRNFAWASGRLELNNEQRAYLSRLSLALPTVTPRQSFVFQEEAVRLFPAGRDILFGSIGPYQLNVFTQKLPSEMITLDACPCSVGSKFNSACYGPTTCTPASGLCQTSPDGCGFLYLHQCNGFCTVDLTGGCG